jgi:hypothetical protein
METAARAFMSRFAIARSEQVPNARRSASLVGSGARKCSDACMARIVLLSVLAVGLVSGPASAKPALSAGDAACTILSAAELATVVPSLGAGVPDHPDDPSGLWYGRTCQFPAKGSNGVSVAFMVAKTKDALTLLVQTSLEKPRAGSNRKIETPAPGFGAQSRIETFPTRTSVTFVQGSVVATLDADGGKKAPDKAKVLALAKLLAGRL